MSSINKVTLMGRIGNIEFKSMQSGTRLCNFSLATSEKWKDKNTGEKKEITHWHKVVVFNEGIVNLLEKYCPKGTLVHIEGKLENRDWTDKDGVKRYITEVVLRPYSGEITLLPNNKNESSASTTTAKKAEETPDTLNDGFEDEIPF